MGCTHVVKSEWLMSLAMFIIIIMLSRVATVEELEQKYILMPAQVSPLLHGGSVINNTVYST